MIDRNTLTLLRIPFSVFLMPVFLFAVSQVEVLNVWHAVVAFLVLHLFIYPASNGYNSYMDKDESSIGGLEKPPMPTRKLFYVSLAFDLIGILLALWVDYRFLLCVVLYMLASRAYSYKGIRLKKYPLIGFLTVMIFQGGFTFYMAYKAAALNSFLTTNQLLLLMLFSSLLIAGAYPLTQVYQHEADRKSGDISISLWLGVKGTFLFSLTMFLGAVVVLFLYCYGRNDLQQFMLFQLFLFPVILYFLWWMKSAWINPEQASFKNTMRMNLISSSCMNLCFITLILIHLYQ